LAQLLLIFVNMLRNKLCQNGPMSNDDTCSRKRKTMERIDTSVLFSELVAKKSAALFIGHLRFVKDFFDLKM
jgi:hypothetical protein